MSIIFMEEVAEVEEELMEIGCHTIWRAKVGGCPDRKAAEAEAEEKSAKTHKT